ncbi:hypothetical protein PR202_ga11883 [Eleusine coracana subsp. coracana]|uniref:F-box domain-containing protein n=1 Tax=Eleusine coracana subsp. coracana TaxID=191504 RepID=A0AAV5CAL0_ELECO|nr:hypothetical protein PR202_ga11883 [Eleusine coracana subsp. coracana]
MRKFECSIYVDFLMRIIRCFVEEAAAFNFSFLGTPHSWQSLRRVLLYRCVATAVFADLVLCDPLHRRYVHIPRIPDDLAVTTGCWGMQEFEPCLDPVSKEEEEQEDLSSLRVICVVHCQHKLVTFHFSSGTRKKMASLYLRSFKAFDPSWARRHLAEKLWAGPFNCYFFQSTLPSLFTGKRRAMAPSPAAPPLLDDIWDDIFRRLDAAEDLARASAVCTSFCRVVRSPRFLRRFRALHPPPVLGFLDPKLGFCTAVPPHGAAPAARALAEAADFTFSFVPTPNLWRVRDARDGRVLLSRRSTVDSTALDDLLVCDPLHRRYVQISPISGDLLGSTRRRTVPRFEPFLAPVAVEEEMEKEPSFRVICNVLFKRNVTAFIFSSVTGKWQGTMPFHLDFTPAIRHYVRNCF